ncbi:MAG: HigA family addiction module antidote protein [Chloroflexia bacterium]|nr:HigA family addiction module antidote protein [Chloroflexia bacterium]
MPHPPIHPGYQIAIELDELHLSATQAAKRLGIPRNRLTDIIRGRRGITADTAFRLAAWLDTTPEFWMNLQRDYEINCGERDHGAEIRNQIASYSVAG